MSAITLCWLVVLPIGARVRPLDLGYYRPYYRNRDGASAPTNFFIIVICEVAQLSMIPIHYRIHASGSLYFLISHSLAAFCFAARRLYGN